MNTENGQNGRRAIFGSTMLSSLVGLAGVIALLALSLINDHRDSEEHARITVENISRVLEEHALATVQKGDLLLREVQRNVRPQDMRPGAAANSVRRRELHLLLKSQAESVPEAAVIHVTDASGNHIYSSLDPVPRINIADWRLHVWQYGAGATFHFALPRQKP